MVIFEIALATPLRRRFDYFAPISLDDATAACIPVGVRVEVPFGRQTLIGILVGIKRESSFAPSKLKAVNRILDNTPCFDPSVLSLCEWAADYYQASFGEMLSTALPTLLRQGHPASIRPQQAFRLTTEGKGLPSGALKRAAKQAELLHLFQQHAYLLRADISGFGFPSTIIKALIDKRIIEAFDVTAAHTPCITDALRERPLTLNEEQAAAFSALTLDTFSVSLIDGATGSGKTEIYLQAIADVLARGQQALVLVPEIGLTPQTLARFQRRFATPLATLHSGLNDRERLDAWLMAQSGAAGIVIGTRSALFTPLFKPGIIIIDEEHDQSFKQQDGVRYSARDLAVLRAKQLNIPLLLGSATPSLETLHNARTGRYQHLVLHKRAGGAAAPEMRIVDIRGSQLTDGFAATSLAAINETLHAGNQVLVFLNRRGYAPTIECQHCGWMAECRHCDARMTLHHTPRHLHCHHCDAQARVPDQCPKCHSRKVTPLGQGTEKNEETLSRFFPDVPVIRVDRDSTRNKDGLAKLLVKVNSGDPCILVGTQMLAKGHHFPDVTLVVVLDADSGLFSTDFRGPERMAQLLLQVAGRSGRAEKAGRVLIQSLHGDHPMLQTLISHGYHALADQLLGERQLTYMPPFRSLALIRAESADVNRAMMFLRRVRDIAEQLHPATNELSYLGPLPALMEKRGDRYRYQLQINTSDRKALQMLLAKLALEAEREASGKQLRWHIDVDPQEL